MAKDFRLCLLFEIYKGVLTEKQQEAFINYYYDDLSLSEISENTGITRQGARDAIKRSEEILTDLEAKLGLCALFQTVRKEIRRIDELCREANHAIDAGQAPRAAALLSEIKTISERLNEDGI